MLEEQLYLPPRMRTVEHPDDIIVDRLYGIVRCVAKFLLLWQLGP